MGASAPHLTPPPRRKTRQRRKANTNRLEQRLGLIAFGLAGLSLALTARLLQGTLPYGATPALSLEEVYNQYMVSTRIVTGVALIFIWPVTLHIVARTLKLMFPRPGYFLTLIGVLLGALTYCLSFLPWPLLASAIVLPHLVALGLILGILGISVGRALALWSLQGALSLSLACFAIWGLESLATEHILNPVEEVPVIYHATRYPDGGVQQVVPHGEANQFPEIIWPSSGSKWLDLRANRVRIVVNLPLDAREWTLHLQASGTQSPVYTLRNEDAPATIPTFAPKPDTRYWLELYPAEVRGGTALIYSLLKLGGPTNANG